MRSRMFAVAAAVAGMGIAVTAQLARAAEKDRHCVVNVLTGAKSCCASFTDAIVKATDGRITDARTAPGS